MHILVFACILTVAAAVTFDQSQYGEQNVQGEIKNIFFVIGYPSIKKIPVESLLAYIMKSSKRSGEESIAQDRADVQSLNAFVEPNTPYRVIIGSEDEKPVEADGSNAVVIAGRRRSAVESDNEEMKLIGATEQCGPERRRDPITLTCKFINDLRVAKPENTPEVVPVPT